MKKYEVKMETNEDREPEPGDLFYCRSGSGVYQLILVEPTAYIAIALGSSAVWTKPTAYVKDAVSDLTPLPRGSRITIEVK